MAYAIIQPPFTLDFPRMPKAELKSYFNWFLASIPERLEILARSVCETSGFELWRPDYTPDSLNELGEWFVPQVDTRQRTDDELRQLEADKWGISNRELTNRTFSLSIDIGMYISQVLLMRHPCLRWEQPLGGKKFVDYGQPVLVRFESGPFNPVRMVTVIAYGITRGKTAGSRLRESYDIWSKLVLT